jgi:hypothetical protein
LGSSPGVGGDIRSTRVEYAGSKRTPQRVAADYQNFIRFDDDFRNQFIAPSGRGKVRLVSNGETDYAVIDGSHNSFVRRRVSMKVYRTIPFIAAALVVVGICAAQAAHKDVKHCADDYRKYCHQWGLETKGLENCMHKHGDRLTNSCVTALVRTGQVSQAEVDRRKKQLGR